MRKPTIQAKPKIHKPVIPVGGKIVSTISAQTYQTATQEEKVSTKDPSPVPQQNSIPLKTSLNDVNGFADLQSNAKVTILFLRKCYDFSYPMIPPNGNPKTPLSPPDNQKAKKNQKHKQKDPQAPIEFDMEEDYDPIRPNDYEMYMEQLIRMKEEEERGRIEYNTRRRSPSISSASSSSSRSRSISPPRYNSKILPHEHFLMLLFTDGQVYVDIEEWPTANHFWLLQKCLRLRKV